MFEKQLSCLIFSDYLIQQSSQNSPNFEPFFYSKINQLRLQNALARVNPRLNKEIFLSQNENCYLKK